MDYTVVTDIFGDKLRRDTSKIPFIVINSVQPELLLEKVFSDTDSVWKLVGSTVYNTLYTNNVNPSHFAPVGHLWWNNYTFPNRISVLLVNIHSDISSYPTDFIKVGSVDSKLNIWKPIHNKDYTSLGYVVSAKKPKLTSVRTVKNSLVSVYKGNVDSKNNRSNMNEFNLLYYNDGSDRVTVNKNIKCKSSNGNKKIKYIKKGKKVALVVPETPWYIVKQEGVVGYRDNADYSSDTVYDYSKPDLGFGYSYSSRNNVEHFNHYKTNCLNFVLICALIYIIYRAYRKSET